MNRPDSRSSSWPRTAEVAHPRRGEHVVDGAAIQQGLLRAPAAISWRSPTVLTATPVPIWTSSQAMVAPSDRTRVYCNRPLLAT